MTQKNLSIIFFTLLTIFGILYFFYDKQLHQNGIESFQDTISKTDSEDFQEFLYENHGKFIRLGVTLSKEMIDEVLDGIKKHKRIVFTAKDGENENIDVKYIIELPDDGRKDFKFDAKSGKLDGYFRTFKDTFADGSLVVDLIPIPPHMLPK
jgi:hypothetical protein